MRIVTEMLSLKIKPIFNADLFILPEEVLSAGNFESFCPNTANLCLPLIYSTRLTAMTQCPTR